LVVDENGERHRIIVSAAGKRLDPYRGHCYGRTVAGGEAEARIAGKAAEGVIARTVGSMVRDAEAPAARAAADAADTAAGTAARDATRTAATHAPGTSGEANLADLVGHTFDAEHPGPLNEKYAGTFADGRYEVGVTGEHETYYRAGDMYNGRDRPELGEFWTDYPPSSVSEVRRDLAVKEEWTNAEGDVIARSPVNNGYAVEMPPGTYYYKGETASQGDPYTGGATQYVFPEPWSYDPPPVKQGEWPLKP
jgi:hypothetical protein